MKNWFECKIRYEKTMENGTQKRVTESYLVDALSFTEAEARITEELSPYMHGGFTVNAVRKMNIDNVVAASGGTWYDCRVMFVDPDGETGAGKKMKTGIYVQGSCLENALKSLFEALKGVMADYEIVSISETPVMDVFVYAVN